MLWIYQRFYVIRDWNRHRRSRSRDRDRDRGRRTLESGKKTQEDMFKGSLSEGQTLTIDLDSDEE